jgi:putative transposase
MTSPQKRDATQRAYRLVRRARSIHYYRSVKDPQTELRQRMREIAPTRVRVGTGVCMCG